MKFSDWARSHFDRDTDFALITGGTSGIGLEFAELVCREHCNCLLLSDEADALEQTKVALEAKYGVTVQTLLCDLADDAALQACHEELTKRSPQIRVLINNAGFGLKGAFDSIPINRYRDIVRVNAFAQTALSHAVLPAMRARGAGLHINVATINVASPIPYNTVYTATKHYVYAYGLAAAQEFEGSGIFFQMLLPGTTATPFHAKQGSTPSAMTMSAREVAECSFADVSRLICIPNRADVILFHVAKLLPIRFKLRLSQYIAKKRLGLKR